MTTRRKFFKQWLILITGSASLAACSNEEQNSSESQSDANKKRLDAFIDTIIPKDQDPGAVEAGVTARLEKYFEKKPKLKQKSQLLFVRIDELAIKEHGVLFSKLNLENREAILTQLAKIKDKNYMIAKVTLHQLKGKIINYYYKSESAWQMLGFSAPYPIGYPDFNKAPPEV